MSSQDPAPPSPAGSPRSSRGRDIGVSWPLVLGLGALALVRPLSRMTGVADAVGTAPAAVGLTLLITLAWIGVVGLGRAPRPVLTLTMAGVAYAVYSMVLSAVLSPILTGSLQGPLANPMAIVPMLITNAVWGAVAGLLALGVQNLRGTGSTR